MFSAAVRRASYSNWLNHALNQTVKRYIVALADDGPYGGPPWCNPFSVVLRSAVFALVERLHKLFRVMRLV